MQLNEGTGFISDPIPPVFNVIIHHGLIHFHAFLIYKCHNKTGTPQNHSAMYRHFSNNDRSYIKVLLKLIQRSAVEASVNISIGVERDMDVGVSEPVLQNDRLHSRFDAPCGECMPE